MCMIYQNRIYLLQAVDIQHNLEKFFFRIDSFDIRWLETLATNNKHRMEQCHWGNGIMLEFCWLHSTAKDQGCDIVWFYHPTCYRMSSSSTLPNRNSIVDPLRRGCEEKMIIVYVFWHCAMKYMSVKELQMGYFILKFS